MRRWTNQTLPQTLQISVFLFYIDAAFGVLFGSAFTPLGLILTAGFVAAGYLISNERKIGYQLGLAISVLGLLPLILFLAREGLTEILDIQVMLYAVFPIARFALLVHPQSQEYQRIWFR